MAGELSFEGRGLPREDELLARVVVDLGLARQGDVLNAVDTVTRARAAGDGKTLAQVLQDTGSLHPRFVRVVLKAVNNKLVAEGHAPVPIPEEKRPPAPPESLPASPKSWPAMPAADPPMAGGLAAAPGPSSAAPPAPPPPKAAAPPPAAEPPVSEPPVARTPAPGGWTRRRQPPPAPPAAAAPPAKPSERQRDERREEAPAKSPREPSKDDREGGDVVLPESIFFKQVPKGQGFSRRSKSEIAAAWAAKRKGGAPASAGEKPPSEKKKEFTAEDRLARLGEPAQPPSAEPTLPGTEPANPLAALVSPREPGREEKPGPAPDPLLGAAGPAEPPGRSGPVDPRVGLGRPPEDEPPARPPRKKGRAGLAALVSPKERRGEPKGPPKQPYRRRKFGSSGATQSIDVNELRAELGLSSKPKAEAGGDLAPPEEKQKSIELQAFVKRAIRSMLHQQCLDLVLRKRMMTVRASELANEAACRDRDARRVLDDWKSAGIMLLDDVDIPDPPYQFSPAKADLATIREFMVAWNDTQWHNKLLGWIIEEEHG